MMNIFKLIYTLILSMFVSHKNESQESESSTAHNEHAYEVNAVDIEPNVDAIATAREYVPKSERIRRIIIKQDNREIIHTRGKQIDIDNWCNTFRVVAKTIMDDEIVLHVI